MTRLQQIKEEFKRQSKALDEKHRQLARLNPDSEYSTANLHEINNLVKQHTRQVSEWLNSPEGRAELIAEKIADVKDREYRYRTVIEDPARASRLSPVTPETIRVMRERQAILAAFVTLYDEQGAEAFMAAYEVMGDRQSLAWQLARSYEATEESEKIAGSELRRGEHGDGGYYQTIQRVDDPIVLSADDPRVERQRNPPAKSKPLYEQTYEEYLESFAASREVEIQYYTKYMPTSRRLAASFKEHLRSWQQAKPMTEREKEKCGTEMRMEELAGGLLSDRERVEGMKLIQSRLDWILIKIRRRRYTIAELCEVFNMPRVLGKALEVYAVGTGRITEDEWKEAFKQPGAQKAVKPRGPYKKRGEPKKVATAPQKATSEPRKPAQECS